jgi:exonuclease III
MLYKTKFDLKLDPTSMMMLDAADIMDIRGWCKQTAQDEKKQVCIMGAMEIARKNHPMASFKEAEYRIQEYIGFSMHYTTWNDNVCVSKKQAVNVLRSGAWVKLP